MKRFGQTRLASVLIVLALLASPAIAGLFDRFGSLSQERILEADQAFQVVITALDSSTVEVRWTIAPGYYLYRNKFQVTLVDSPNVGVTTLDIPAGEPKDDPNFGPQEVFYKEAIILAHLRRDTASGQPLQIKAAYQGCAEIGVCYPPMTQTVALTLPPLSAAPRNAEAAPVAAGTSAAIPVAPLRFSALPDSAAAGSPPGNESEQDRLARLLNQQRFWAIPVFFGLGMLLAFTPCVFPMIPILSTLIIGQGTTLTRRRAILLSLTYVLAMAVTYTAAGLLAALLGQNIQAWFQNPWVLGLFSLLFVLLALSMFGLYELQLPTRLQTRLIAWSNRQRGGQHLSVAMMGLLSALIVSPCVAPPLIGILTFIAATGDVAIGGLTLFALSMGMGAPLLLIGASAGHWLPHAGPWMARIKLVFGVLLLMVALSLLERILPAAMTMVLWATLLIVTATYMGVLQPVAQGAPMWRVTLKGLGLVLLIYGTLLLVGMAAGGRDPWQPLRGVSLAANAASPAKPLVFHSVKTVTEIEQVLGAADGRPVLLDFYADWCASCKEMERYTFTDPTVQAALVDLVTLRADVTANNPDDRQLLKRFGIVGPPAILFFGSDGRERRDYRVVGFVKADAFSQHLHDFLRAGS